MKRFWEHPHAWLEDQLKQRDRKWCEAAFAKILPLVGQFELAQAFHEDMTKDGFFEPHVEPEEIEVGTEVRVRCGCDLKAWEGRQAFVTAWCDRYPKGLPVMLFFPDDQTYEIFEYTEIRKGV